MMVITIGHNSLFFCSCLRGGQMEGEIGKFPKKGRRALIGSAILVIVSFRRGDSCSHGGRVGRHSIHRWSRASDPTSSAERTLVKLRFDTRTIRF